MHRRQVLAALAGAVAVTPALMRAASGQPMSDATQSAAFKRFRFSFFDDPNSARDGLDEAALAELSGEERERAEGMLIAFLPDSRAIIGLGVLRSRLAEPQLMRLFTTERALAAGQLPDEFYNAYQLVYLATALWRIRPDPRWVEAITDVLARSGEWTSRQEAAMALYAIRAPAAEAALTKALDDPQGLVRHHASRALLALHGTGSQMNPTDMTIRIMSEDAARREGGKRDILSAIEGRPITLP
jgi:hypothetical protein